MSWLMVLRLLLAVLAFVIGMTAVVLVNVLVGISGPLGGFLVAAGGGLAAWLAWRQFGRAVRHVE